MNIYILKHFLNANLMIVGIDMKAVIVAKLDENNTEEIPVYTVIPYQYEID